MAAAVYCFPGQTSIQYLVNKKNRGEIMSARRFFSKSLVTAFVGAIFFLLPSLANADSEWLTWGHDPERTGSNPDENILNKGNVSQLQVKWVAQISTAPKG
jgi:hypothetical protein